MEQDDAILTFSAPAREPGRVDAIASPVFELLYASFFVTKRGVPPGPGSTPPAWLRRFSLEAPETLRAVADFWRQRGHEQAGAETLLLATRFGYVRDPDPERFLRDFARLPGRYLDEGTVKESATPREESERIAARLELLRDPETAAAWAQVHRGFWRLLGPYWERERRPAVESAAAAFMTQLGVSGDVLSSFPRHHFAQFEAAVAQIRKAEKEGRVLVVPMGLAVSGGFLFDVDGAVYIGFGVQAERVHERTAQRVAELAPRMKAFADPTRAMLLAVIARFEGLQFTVGDLAQQLGVSQPTVSGHLRQLRDAGLVHIERRGNKAYHRLDRDALHGLLAGFEAAVVEGADSENGSSA
jgi:ArsR family transcriptional regulator, arsenate/arsenite/antimonite-responsive transcriptional repressor